MMEIKAKVFKRRSGKSKGKWTARIEYFDRESGRNRTLERTKDTKGHAVDERDRLVNELKKSDGGMRKGERMTFCQLADICAELFYKRAVIVDGRKIEGVRSFATYQNYLTVLKDYFGNRRIGSITTESLKDYRRWRLRNGSRRPHLVKNGEFIPVKLATINRELTLMRSILRYALAEGWVTRDIFFKAGVIDASAELERTRILTPDEETRLLAACQGVHRTTYERVRFGRKETITANIEADNLHLKAIILLALDAGMRRGEIMKLRWQDIDSDANLIRILGTHTKTERERIAPLTTRIKEELVRVREFSTGDNPFPFASFKNAWKTAKRIAGIGDLRFHDLRRTAVTRWQMYGLPLAMAGKLAGHTQLKTTQKYYTATDNEMVRDFAEKMNTEHARAMPEPENGFVN